MTRDLATLRAVEEAAAARLKKLIDTRHDAQDAMEHAHSRVICDALPNEDIERLDREFVTTLGKALDAQFETLIDEAEANLWTARLAIEELEDEAPEVRAQARAA